MSPTDLNLEHHIDMADTDFENRFWAAAERDFAYTQWEKKGDNLLPQPIVNGQECDTR